MLKDCCVFLVLNNNDALWHLSLSVLLLMIRTLKMIVTFILETHVPV